VASLQINIRGIGTVPGNTSGSYTVNPDCSMQFQVFGLTINAQITQATTIVLWTDIADPLVQGAGMMVRP
jgi:hypothetical protein